MQPSARGRRLAGLGGIGSVVLGRMIDSMGVTVVIQICSWLPLLGVFALWLPKEGTQSGMER